VETYLIDGRIRKIIIGGQKDGFIYEVGRTMNKAGFTISSIIFNATHFDVYGEVRYEIYVTKDGGDSKAECLWKHFANLPLSVEYFV
jgi:hypothetical protein